MKVVCPHCAKEFDWKKKKKSYQPGTRDPLRRLKTIINFLKTQESWVWIRRVAKSINMKPYTVSYLIDKYLLPYLEILEPMDVYETTGIRMRMFRLKNQDINVDSVIEDIKKRTNT